MPRLIPVYPPDSVKGIDEAPAQTIDVVVTRFRSTDRLDTGQHGGLGPTVPLRIVGGNPLRRVVTITNEGAVDIYIGNENVGISDGKRLGIGQSITLETGGDVYGITPGGVGVVHWLAEIEAS